MALAVSGVAENEPHADGAVGFAVDQDEIPGAAALGIR